VQRLKRRYQPDSVGGVQHGNRRCPMRWALSDSKTVAQSSRFWSTLGTTPRTRSLPLTPTQTRKRRRLYPPPHQDPQILTHGTPLSRYRDRHEIFQRNEPTEPQGTPAEQLAEKQSPAQPGRALEELSIQQVPA
jgi:hypothetical protein